MSDESSVIKYESFVYSKGSQHKPITSYKGYYIKADYTVNTPDAIVCSSSTEIDNATDTFTQVDHGLITGVVLQATTSSALPTGLSLATDYYVIRLTDDTFQLATSLANAKAATALSISDDGTGDQTFTPVALAGASVKLQGSHEKNPITESNWVDIADSSVSITATGSQAWNVADTYYASVRYYLTITSGQIDISGNFNGKGA